MNGPATQQIAQNALGDSILCDRLKTGRRSNRLTKYSSSVDRGHVGGQHHWDPDKPDETKNRSPVDTPQGHSSILIKDIAKTLDARKKPAVMVL